MTLRTRLARAAWHLKRAVRILVERNRYVRVDAPSTADWHAPVEPSHPSALCRCPGHEYFHSGHRIDIDHLPECEWLKRRCITCDGNGWCVTCGGDGCRVEEQA